MTKRLVDDEARRIAVERLDGPLCVEAGAGTGKTTLLVERFLALVRADRARCAQIVAITFTEKAAGEMKLRIRRRIDRALAGESPPAAEGERLGDARRELEGAPISTIHAFASAVIREFPVEAGIDPAFDVLDPVEAELVLDECWLEFLSGAGEEGDAALRPFLEAGGTHETLRDIAFALYQRRGARRSGAAREIDIVAAAEALRRELLATADELEALAERDCTDHTDRGYGAIARFAGDARRLADIPAAALPGRLLSFAPPPRRAGARSNWQPKESCDLQKERLAGARASLAAFAALRADDVRDGLLRWLDGFVSLVDRRKEERGMLDFDDLLLRAARVTEHPGAVAELRRRYRYFLVDEFQDTDPLQARILLSIAGSDETGRVTGNFFVVGDPKQSIYRFRGADVEIYEEVAGKLDRAGARLSITQNFRSVPGIAAWVNGVFSSLIAPPPNGGYQARYEPIDAWREGRGPAVFALDTGGADGALAVEARRAEGIAIARLVAGIVAEGPPVRDAVDEVMRPAGYGDIAVLYPGTTGIRQYEEPFRSAGIPCVVDGGKLYYMRQEVRDVAAALAAIEAPWDGLSVFAVLRSPFFGFSDEELFLQAADCGFDYRHAGGEGDLGAAFVLLRDLHDRRGERGAAGTLAALFEETGYRRLAALRRDGDRRLLDLQTAVDLARRFDRHHRSFRSFARWFAERDEAGAAAGESPAVEEGGDAVRLMTIHRAKGLQFPVVILANLLQRRGGGRGGGVRLLAGDDGSVELRAGRLETSGFEAAAAGDALREEAERIRLMYVAATRAGDRLYIPVGGGDRSYFALLAGGLPAGGTEIDSGAPPPDAAETITIDDLPSLPTGRGVFRPAVVDGDASFDDEAWRNARAALIGRASAAPAIRTPSGAEREWTETPFEDGGRDGEGARRFGVAFHELMESLPLDDPAAAQAVAAEIAGRHGLEANEAMEMVRLARRALELDVMRRAAAASRLCREMPFAVALNREDAPDSRSGNLLRGRIDLLFEDGPDWTAIDYKTDDIDENAVEARLDRYRPQGALYALAARRLGLHIGRVVFLFVRPAVARTIPVDDALIDAARRIVDGADA